MKKLTVLILSAFLFLSAGLNAYAAADKQIDANIKTKRVPAGTIIPLKILDPAGSNISAEGWNIYLSVTENILADDIAAIPEGSIVRGSVESASAAKRLYKGGFISFYFDHIVSISGRQVPFHAVIHNNPNAVYGCLLGTGTTYSDAFRKTIETTKKIASKPVAAAWEKGGEMLNGSPKYVLAPVTAVFTGIAAGFYFIGGAIADIFKKGEDITLNQGDIIQVKLVKPLDMPVY